MNREENLTIMQKIRKQQMEKEYLLHTKKKYVLRYKRVITFTLLVAVLSALLIFVGSLLFSHSSKSYAYETHQLPVKKELTITNIPSKIIVTPQKVTQKAEPSIYNPSIPMPKEEQEYLYQMCKERGLDYKKTLALIHHESRFDANKINETHDYGYFQINEVNHQELAEKLHTANSALNPYININWGTFVLSNLYKYWGDKGFKDTELDEVVWSSYNKGIMGFQHTGKATVYITQMYQSIDYINHSF